MTYTGAMVLPSNAVCLQDEEMRYVEGGKSWTKYFTTQNKLHKYQYKVYISNISAAGIAAVAAAGSIAIMIGVLTGGMATGASVAVLKASMASKLWEAIGSSLVCYASLASFRSNITITKTKTYY